MSGHQTTNSTQKFFKLTELISKTCLPEKGRNQPKSDFNHLKPFEDGFKHHLVLVAEDLFGPDTVPPNPQPLLPVHFGDRLELTNLVITV